MIEYLILSWKNIVNRKLRSYLTIVGIVIGVTALVSLVTLGQGLEDGITEQFDKFGTNIIWIGPKTLGLGGPPAGVAGLTEKDAENIERLPIVDFTAPFVQESVELEYNREVLRADIFAVKAEIARKLLENVDIKLSEGRFLEKGDGKVAFIGWRVHKDMFEKEIPLRASLKINGEKFRVVGIKEEVGSSQEDNQIMIPLQVMQDFLGDDEGVSAFSAVLHKGIDAGVAAERIERELERRRDDENFEVTSPSQIQEQTGVILSVVKWVVAAIASISLIVGGLGIMNTMYSSILERTREIGVMKAVGAAQNDILTMILIESGCMGFVGGMIGVLLGLGISYGLGFAINSLGAVKISISTNYTLLAFGLLFAFVLGSVSGLLPALRASKMQPVEALRYE